MRKVLITGGSRGIGAAMVQEFSKDHEVTFTYHTGKERAEKILQELEGRNGLKALPLNLNDKDSIRHLTASHHEFDIIIHNAASTADQAFYFLDEEQWSSVIDSSLNSFFYLNKAVLPHMIQNRWGRIIVMASISGEAGQRGQCNYAASKGALIAASKSLAKEVARKGVLVNVVSPGFIATDMTENVPVKEVLPLIPVGRIGQAHEVAKAVRFLASDDASYINGTILQVNGGLYT